MWAGQDDRDCIVCAGVLIYVSPGVRQSLTARDIIIVVEELREGIVLRPPRL